MSEMIPGQPLQRIVSRARSAELDSASLATPVVLWGGWPFFQRGWASLVNRSLNMFTLIALGIGTAYRLQRDGDALPRHLSAIVPRSRTVKSPSTSKPRR